jgi:tripartite-type tricarboxylate transporter receptor subunit TctC
MKKRNGMWIALASIVFITTLIIPMQASGAEYPSRPIEVVVCWPPGGGADVVTRIVCKYAEKLLKQNINVVNADGGSGTIGYNKAAMAKPDGYTLVNLQTELTSIEAQKLASISRDKFTPIICAATQSAPLITRSDSGFASFADFVEACKKAPGKINVGGSPKNTIFELAATLMMADLGINFNYVAMAGSPKVLTAMAGNHIGTGFCWLSVARDYIQKGEMKGLVVLADKRLPEYPTIPTMKELGHDITYRGYYGIGAPAGLDKEVKAVLEKAFLSAVNDPQCQEELKTKAEVEINVLNAEQFSKFLENEYKVVSRVFEIKSKQQ